MCSSSTSQSAWWSRGACPSNGESKTWPTRIMCSLLCSFMISCGSTCTSLTETAMTDPENIDEMLSLANSLRQSLERELRQIERCRRPDGIQQIYDLVYLPRLIALSHHANRYVEFEGWQLLCQPLHTDLAETQIRIVIEMLGVLLTVV